MSEAKPGVTLGSHGKREGRPRRDRHAVVGDWNSYEARSVLDLARFAAPRRTDAAKKKTDPGVTSGAL